MFYGIKKRLWDSIRQRVLASVIVIETRSFVCFDSLLYYGLGIERDLRDHVCELKIRWRGVWSKSNDSTWHRKPSKSNGNKKICNRKCKKSNVFPQPHRRVRRRESCGEKTESVRKPLLFQIRVYRHRPEKVYGKSFRHVLYKHPYSHGCSTMVAASESFLLIEHVLGRNRPVIDVGLRRAIIFSGPFTFRLIKT